MIKTDHNPTQRQAMVLLMIADGDSNEEIAYELERSVNTVKTDVGKLMKMFGARNRANLVALAYQKGIIEVK